MLGSQGSEGWTAESRCLRTSLIGSTYASAVVRAAHGPPRNRARRLRWGFRRGWRPLHVGVQRRRCCVEAPGSRG